MTYLDMQIEISTLLKFLGKFVFIIVFIWLMAVITPKLSGKTDKAIKKFKKNKKNNSSNEENIYKTDVFGAYVEEKKTDKKTDEKNHNE